LREFKKVIDYNHYMNSDNKNENKYRSNKNVDKIILNYSEINSNGNMNIRENISSSENTNLIKGLEIIKGKEIDKNKD